LKQCIESTFKQAAWACDRFIAYFLVAKGLGLGIVLPCSICRRTFLGGAAITLFLLDRNCKIFQRILVGPR